MKAGSRKGTVAATLVAVAAVLALPAPAAATVESAQLGTTAAQFSYDTGGDGAFTNLNLKIIRNGMTLVDQPPVPPPAHGPGTGTGSLQGVGPAFGGQQPSVHVLQLDASPDPEVVFDLFSGGAHCCFYSMIFRFNPPSTSYLSIVHDWLDQGYKFKDLDGNGISEFSSSDGNFAYAFGSFAGSRFPPQIWSLVNGQLVDVTRQFPDVVRADLRSVRRLYKRFRGKEDVRPLLAAFTADQCLLGSCGKGFKLVRKAVRRGELLNASGTEPLRNPGKFPGELRRLLRKLGYL